MCAPWNKEESISVCWSLIPGTLAAEAGGVPKDLLIALEIMTGSNKLAPHGDTHGPYLSLSLSLSFFFSGWHSVCTDTGSPEKRNCIFYNFYWSEISGKIITERFVEDTLLIQTIHCTVAIKKFYEEQEIKKKKKGQDLGLGLMTWNMQRT